MIVNWVLGPSTPRVMEEPRPPQPTFSEKLGLRLSQGEDTS